MAVLGQQLESDLGQNCGSALFLFIGPFSTAAAQAGEAEGGV